MYVVSRPADPLSEMIRAFYQKEMTLGSTKKAVEARENRMYGRREGAAQCIAALLTVARLEEYTFLDMVPAVTDWDVMKTLKQYIERVEQAHPSKSSIGEKLPDVLAEAYQAVVNLVKEEGLHEQNAHARRQLIEKGQTELMTPEDREYYAAMRDTIQASAEDYDRLASIEPRGVVGEPVPYLTKNSGQTEI